MRAYQRRDVTVIKLVTVVERAKEAWVFVQHDFTYWDDDLAQWASDGYEHELVAVFESIAELFTQWDVEAESLYDVTVLFDGQEEQATWLTKNTLLEADPEHVMV
jgi:hypothetical protein